MVEKVYRVGIPTSKCKPSYDRLVIELMRAENARFTFTGTRLRQVDRLNEIRLIVRCGKLDFMAQFRS